MISRLCRNDIPSTREEIDEVKERESSAERGTRPRKDPSVLDVSGSMEINRAPNVVFLPSS